MTTTDLKPASPVFALRSTIAPAQLPDVLAPKMSAARDFAAVQDVIRDGDALLRTVRPVSTSFLQRCSDCFSRNHMQTSADSLWAFGPGFLAALAGGAISMMIDPSGHTALVVAPSLLGVCAAVIPASQITQKLAAAQRRNAPQVCAEALQPAVDKFDAATGVEKAARGKVLSNLLTKLDADGGLQTTALENLRDVRNATLGLPPADVDRSAELMALATRLKGLKSMREHDYYAVRKVTETLPPREAAELTTEIVDFIRERKAVDDIWFGWLEALRKQYLEKATTAEAAEKAATDSHSE